MGMRKVLTRNAEGKRIMEEIGKQDKVSATDLCMTNTAKHSTCASGLHPGNEEEILELNSRGI